MAMRRTHRKSRYGCRGCKQRHIKCDESKPSCLNCLAVERYCSYLDNASNVHTPPPSGSSGQLPMPSPATRQASAPPAHTSNESAPPPPVALGEDYTLTHIELFHHFEHGLSQVLSPSVEATPLIMELTVQKSLSFPYLMDEVLAFAAAHKSTLDPERKHLYLAEATRLQTRGLSRFNTGQTEISKDNCVAAFLYSAILGQHVLFDTFSLQSDLAAVLTKFVQCLSLQAGIRTIASNSWETIRTALLWDSAARVGPLDPVKPDDECARLVDLLDESELAEEAKDDCRHAVKALQFMFSRHRLGTFRGGLSVQEWAVRVPRGYVALLNQRRPEALVILVYYAVLLHYDRAHWAIGNTGAYLVRSITQHMGEYWAKWLEWPNQVITETSTPASTTAADQQNMSPHSYLDSNLHA
ncbi:uncharacterized protein DNG_01680 [Cephalotrichum gorgonifer]|uniref:Zn(2)-C6 fungal-type domain-containing protein n=1 Tax=Cephalotrichum gorgonifer TaxID=2041049 RepID=A0AAE8MS55_9PEZI|nr:uncharacterized protein DNG_01680 [Cephalotrichum gorgonifer]